jgi:hypothetical protein
VQTLFRPNSRNSYWASRSGSLDGATGGVALIMLVFYVGQFLLRPWRAMAALW